jgi:L-rhamnose mutarotase
MTIRITRIHLLISLFLVATVCVAAGFQKADKPKVKRYGAVIEVKADKLDYYKELHAKPWPSINEALKTAHISNYTIYLTQFDDGKWYLFAYYEYTGKDYEADMKIIGENSEVKRWWVETDPCQEGLKNRKEGEWWKEMEEVYRLD